MFLEESEALLSFFEGLGDLYISAMGINVETFFSEVGFYSYIFTFVGLIAAIQAMHIGLNTISKENRMKTADFLMTKPKNRTAIYFSKLLACICSLVITQILFYIVSYISMVIVTDGDFAFTSFALISLSFTFIQMIFLTLGIFVATIITKMKSVISITMGISFGFFLFGMMSEITSSKVLKYFALLRYFDSNYIMANNAYETKFLAISIAIPIVLTIASYIIYVKKDVPSV